MSVWERRATIIFLAIGLLAPVFVKASTVLSSHKYAWSNNVGYINFENVIVSDSALSGYAWSTNAGWIKFNPSQGGVTNDGTGNLSGSAWGEQLGWIDFGNVSISPTTGQFSGTATGTLVGTITFDCPNYCDVRTDWPGTASPVTIATGGGGGYSPSPITTPGIPTHIITHNESLNILPGQSGTFTEDTAVGTVILDVPVSNLSSETTFIINVESLTQDNAGLILSGTKLVNDVFYDITAQDNKGNYIHDFPFSITITLPLPQNLMGIKNLAVYWLNEVNQQWVLIPDAIFSSNAVTFQVNHLTRFAVLGKNDLSVKGPARPATSIPVPVVEHPPQVNTNQPPSEQPTNVNQAPSKRSLLEKINDFIDKYIPIFSNLNQPKPNKAGDNSEKLGSRNIVQVSDQSLFINLGWSVFIVIVILVVVYLISKRGKK